MFITRWIEKLSKAFITRYEVAQRKNKPKLPTPELVVTHDFTVQTWGRSYTFQTRDSGRSAEMMGWGSGIKKGHFLILKNKGTTRYRVVSIHYYKEPTDMFLAKIVFAPRSMEEYAKIKD
jgi:hypothetical protein